MSEVDLATAAVEFTARTTAPGLMLEDYSARNRQRFQDGLWMEGIKGAVALMLIGLCLFFAYGSWLQSDLDDLNQQVREDGAEYTNALSLKAKMQTLNKQEALKTAVGDAWVKVGNTNLPPELKFTQLMFSSDRTLEGNTSRKLRIVGTADAGKEAFIDDYNLALTRMEVEGSEGQKLFSDVIPGPSRKDPRKKLITWSVECKFDGE
jgi:hypothetical protein